MSRKWFAEQMDSELKRKRIEAVNYRKSMMIEIYGDEYAKYVARVRVVDFSQETSSLRLAIDDPTEELPDELMLAFIRGLEKEVSAYVDEYEARVVQVDSLMFRYCPRCRTLSVGKCRTCQDPFISGYNLHYLDHADSSFF
jgi:hypothetical protein